MKNQKIFLSIIIPVYNGSKSILRCIESIYDDQDVDKNTYEVIVIDDCSIDNTKLIVQECQRKYPSLILLEHTENKRQGAARNSGMNIATGKYVMFVDADDYIMPNCLTSVSELLKNANIDILEFAYEEETADGKLMLRTLEMGNHEIVSGKDFLERRIQKHFAVFSKIYRLQFFREKELRFFEKVVFEDVDFICRSTAYATTIMYISTSLYMYKYNLDSTTRTSFSVNRTLDGTRLALRLYDIYKEFESKDAYISHEFLNSAQWTAKKNIKSCRHLLFRQRIEFLKKLKTDEFERLELLIKGSVLSILININPLFASSIISTFSFFINTRSSMKNKIRQKAKNEL